jgi:ribosomal protein S12 methylthiotransferase
VLGFIASLREAMPDIVLRTSFIAGFPGETEAEFDQLLAFARQVQFDHAGCFTYSRQRWTEAFEHAPQVPDVVKHERRDRFMSQQARIAAKRAKRFRGRVLDMLIEGDGADDDGRPLLAGRTYREAPEVDGLVFAYGTAPVGARARVHIDQAAGYDLWGRLV